MGWTVRVVIETLSMVRQKLPWKKINWSIFTPERSQ
jgi:hypothetical protein